MRIVNKILNDVGKNGDSAVKEYSRKFDNFNSKKFEISNRQIKQAYKSIDKKTLTALEKCKKNISLFVKEQFKQLKNFEIKIDNNTIGQKIIPIEKVGCYVPGGRYPLPSSALMGIIPAKIAGCKEIIVCSPKIKPETIVAADLSGATKIFNVGGIQAIAAMAFGTTQIPKVDKIVGPGNKYVAEAKRQLFGTVGIDFIAGPSELCIISDQFSKPEYIAADLLAQAEHDSNVRTFLISNSKKIIKNVQLKIKNQLVTLKTKNIAAQSIKNLKIFKVDNILDAVIISNAIAPEHLSLQLKKPNKIINKLTNYGSLFIGKYSAEVFGDYCSGTNHILPTNGASRYTGGLSVFDFVKIVSYQQISKKGAKKLGLIVSTLAKIEGLDGHRKSSGIR